MDDDEDVFVYTSGEKVQKWSRARRGDTAIWNSPKPRRRHLRQRDKPSKDAGSVALEEESRFRLPDRGVMD